MPLATDARRSGLTAAKSGTLSSGRVTLMNNAPPSYYQQPSSTVSVGSQSACRSTEPSTTGPGFALTAPCSNLSSALWENSPPLPPDEDMLFIEMEQMFQDAQADTRETIEQSVNAAMGTSVQKIKSLLSQQLAANRLELEAFSEDQFEERFDKIGQMVDEKLTKFSQELNQSLDRKFEELVHKVAEHLVAAYEVPKSRSMTDSLSYSRVEPAGGLDVSFGTIGEQSFLGKSVRCTTDPLLPPTPPPAPAPGLND